MNPEAEIFDRLRKVEMQIGTHEAVCAERYTGILKSGEDTQSSIDRIHRLMIKIGLGLITIMGGVLIKLVFFPHGG
jgi:hypothetical protein